MIRIFSFENSKVRKKKLILIATFFEHIKDIQFYEYIKTFMQKFPDIACNGSRPNFLHKKSKSQRFYVMSEPI